MSKVLDKIEVDATLLEEAAALDIDVRREIELALREKVDKRKREKAWQAEHRDAILAWNDYVERYGLWYERIERS